MSKKKAYLESEKQLNVAKERRDNLTKHLHTIIISNESRKANRLQQLMSTLQEESETSTTQPHDNTTDEIKDLNIEASRDGTLKKNNVVNQYSGPL